MQYQDCVKEIRAFAQFGGYALDLLPRVAPNIFEHFKVQPRHRLLVLGRAGVPQDVIGKILGNSAVPLVLSGKPMQAGRSGKPGTASGPASSAPRRPRKRRDLTRMTAFGP